MRIVYLTPGTGGSFYCENCVRDAMLLRQLHKLGCEAIALPMYLPAGSEQKDISHGPLFFGGVNVWLQQHFALFRKTPRWVDLLLDSSAVLSVAVKKVGMTTAGELGQTTLSMLQGRNGRQLKELNRLLDWLILSPNKPDVVVLSNALLLGLAAPLREVLHCSVVCLLQDEDGFVESLGDPWSAQVWQLMERCARDVDLFIAASDYYRTVMTPKLNLDKNKIHILYPGLPLNDYQFMSRLQTPTIGFLARMCEDNGLDILIEAMHRLLSDQCFRDVKLLIAGGTTAADEPFVRRLRRQIHDWQIDDKIEFIGDFDKARRKEFLSRISVMCVPFRRPAACGMCVVEAMAAGVGFVQPDEGVFQEYAKLTEAGLLYKPNNPIQLTRALRQLILDVQTINRMGQNGRQAAMRYFDIAACAEQWMILLEGVKRQ